MGISLSQYRAAIGLWRRLPAQSKKSYDMNAYESLHGKKINNVFGLINIMNLVCIVLLHSAVLDLGLSTSLMSRKCLQSLLLISGVEQNPGPISQQDIIDELCIKSTNDLIRNVLRAYPLNKTLTHQKREIKKIKNDDLILTLEFLKVTNQGGCNKTELVHNLIVRIQNLLPDTCGLCKQEYNTGLDDTPLLSCEVCGQGSHNPCINTLLGIEESEESSLDPQKVRKMIIPLELPGVHYLCMTCSGDIVPDDGPDGILKNKLHDSADEDGNSLEEVQPSVAVEAASTPLTPIVQEDIQSRTDPEPNGSLPQPQSQSRNQGNDGRAICIFFKKGQCKHGISGKGCKHRHPQPCKKLIRHGARAPNGCTLGRSRCDKFHPNMCPASMSKGECTDSFCKLWHVSGTRKSHKNKTTTSGHQMGAKSPIANLTSAKENPNDFLGLLQSWKLEMMQAMDTKLAMALKPTVIPSPRPQSLETMSMMAHNHLLPQSYHNLAMGGQRNFMTSGQPVLVQMFPNVMY